MRYLKVLAWTAAIVALLTVAQYGSVHLLTGRPSSWLFEASLDAAPPLLFPGDIAESALSNGSQAPLHEETAALAGGVLLNIALYSLIAVLVAWLFFPSEGKPMRRTLSALDVSEAKRTR